MDGLVQRKIGGWRAERRREHLLEERGDDLHPIGRRGVVEVAGEGEEAGAEGEEGGGGENPTISSISSLFPSPDPSPFSEIPPVSSGLFSVPNLPFFPLWRSTISLPISPSSTILSPTAILNFRTADPLAPISLVGPLRYSSLRSRKVWVEMLFLLMYC